MFPELKAKSGTQVLNKYLWKEGTCKAYSYAADSLTGTKNDKETNLKD